jgi:hypothetical protein
MAILVDQRFNGGEQVISERVTHVVCVITFVGSGNW